MSTRIASVFSRLFDVGSSREQVHFHNAGGGRAIVCHDERCESPRLDLRDAPATQSFLR
ncbi:MAG TPA: hypothetical protein VGM91_09680 [Conexibacter sp.]|jgi:hypothetical protein